MKSQIKTVECQICKKEKRMGEVVPAELIRDSVIETIRKAYPDWSAGGYICKPDLNRFRAEHVRKVLETEKGEVAELELQVINSLKEQELFAHNMNVEYDTRRTFGERLADRIAEFGGSWRFIILFGAILFTWIAINTVALLSKSFDPFPYILLNLVLSCLAAIQAPVIMMSQNRQEVKDRMRAQNDYKINLKAELEIRHLHEKVDHLLLQQWERLTQIQEIQLEVLSELGRR